MSDFSHSKLLFHFRQDTVPQPAIKDTAVSGIIVKSLTKKPIVSEDTLHLPESTVHSYDTIHVADSLMKNLSEKKPVKILTVPVNQKETLTNIEPAHRIKIIKENQSWNTPEDLAHKLFSENGDLKTYIDRNRVISQVAVVSGNNSESAFFQRLQSNNDWIFWTFIVVTLLFVWIQVFYRKYFISLLNSITSYQASLKLFSEKNVLVRRVSMVLNFIYTLSVSLIIFRIIQYLGLKPVNIDKFSLFLIILNLVILFSVIKTLIQKIIGFVFNATTQINEYLHNVYVYNKSLGIILLPISFAAFYSSGSIAEILLFAAIILYFLSILFKIIRGFQIIIKNDVFIFYTILYLCSLEILPLIIGYNYLKTLA